MTYAFEYTLECPPRRTATDPVPLPELVWTTKLPITLAGLAGLSASILGQNILPSVAEVIPGRGLSIAGICVAAPVTTLAMVAVAWKNGRLGEWWAYYQM